MNFAAPRMRRNPNRLFLHPRKPSFNIRRTTMTKATEVITPGRFPAPTFVEDHLVERKRQLLDTLEAEAMLVSISGLSKSGKTIKKEKKHKKHNQNKKTKTNTRTTTEKKLRVFD